jgi:tRNA 5-methylaminomethyl-2-thiouridine biosynthesis bifunctional protein
VRTLQESGFAVAKHPGFGQKREMLRGALRDDPLPTHSSEQPGRWLQLPRTTATPAHVLVIGAGLAGCSTAWSLAQRGCRVSVLERHTEIAAGASGNRQGVLQCRLNNAVDGAWQFNLQAFLFASRHFDAMQSLHPSIHWQRCGVLNLDTAFSSRSERCPDVRLDLYANAVVQRVDQTEASALAGTTLDGGGNFIPLGGWLRPAALCAAWLQHPLISVHCDTQVSALIRHADKWRALSPEGQLLAEADNVVIANSTAAASLAQTAHLPLVPLRGQLSHLRASAQSSLLQTVVCGRSYISPSLQGEHCAGASYSKDVSDLSLSMREQSENLAGIMPHLPEADLDDSALSGGRVAVRAGSPDRTPMGGPAVDVVALETLFRSLPQHERKQPSVTLPSYPGLYINVGHGSHGIGNTPLLAEYLASLMCQEPLPLQTSVLEALHPARFILRRLRREPARG